MTAANVSPGTLHSSSFVIRTDVFCFLNEWKWIPETAKRQMPYGQSRFLVSLGSSSSSLSVAAAAAAPTSTNEKDDVETGTSREKKERSTSNALVITAAVAKLSASHRKKNSRQQPHGEEEGSTLRGSLLGATQPRERATTRMI